MKEKNTLKKTLIYLMIITSTIYIIWRIFFTVPIHLGIWTLIFSICLLTIEIWDYVEFVIYYKNILSKSNSKSNKKILVRKYPDVDVIIATINEKEELLQKTIQGCLNMEYPDKNKVHIYICDDGNRKEIKELAQKNNINYITRNNNKDAKAGNYNNALKYLKSEYIATFDADMVPDKYFLVNSMPFFCMEEKVGFVQTPQAFYNFDIFQNRFRLGNEIPFDQSFFYNELQPAKARINATVYCGTNAILSRKALDEIGGFATGTLTEDIATRNANRRSGI